MSIYDHLAKQIETNIEERHNIFNSKYLYEKDGHTYLNLEERKLIVNQCLHGVDINQECIEVARLSLSLKIIDGFEPCDFNNAGLYGSQILRGVG